jgi:RsmE family RNA methyltransferase
MNIILFSHNETKHSTITVTDYRARHISKIIKAKKDDTLITGEINGPKGTSRIQQINAASVTFTDITHTQTTPRPQIDLIMALPRPIMLKRVLAQAATFGVNHLFLINSNRVEKSFFSSSKMHPEKIHHYLLTGLEQGCATMLPTVSIHKRFRPFIEDELPKQMQIYTHSGIAHPNTQTTINTIIPTGATGQILLVIGPEGGWVDYEVAKFNELGITPFTMGERIVRVDSVVPALLSQLALLKSM